MIKFAICDNNQKMLDSISNKLHAYYPDECEIKTYTDGTSLLLTCFRSCFDALFLNIDMPGSNGMEIAGKICEIDWRVKIIFVSKKNGLLTKAIYTMPLDL